MEQQTILERRFGSLTSRRKKQQDAVATTIYKSTNTAPARADTFTEAEAGRLTDSESTTSSPSSLPETNALTSVETLSDTISVVTPSGVPIMVPHAKRHKEVDDIFNAPALHLAMPSMPQKTMPASPRPVLVSSLSKPSDFSFDRYSEDIGPPDLEEIEVLEVSEVAYSPIEVATPITYIKPNRPSMVSIFNILDKGSGKETRKSVSIRPVVPTRNPERPPVNKRLSTYSTRSGFMAGEATPFEVPDLPGNALTMISNASQTDLSTHTRQPEPALKKQKSSMTLLSKAFKYGHSRMTSRTQSISPSPSRSSLHNHHRVLSAAPLPAPISRLPPTPSGRSVRPQTAVAPRASSPSVMTALSPFSAAISRLPPTPSSRSVRPQTAVEPRASSPGVTALPPCSATISQLPSPQMAGTSRKKSISMLRSRSDSLSKSLMSMAGAGSGARARNLARGPSPPVPVPSGAASPPVPILMTPAKRSVDLSAFPPPPPPAGARLQSNRGSVVSFSRPLGNSAMPLRGLGLAVN